MSFEEYWKQYWTPSTMPGAFDEAMKEIARKAWDAALLQSPRFAAPDLLAALKGVACVYTSGSEVSHLPYLGTGTRGDIESKWRAVLAAIEKYEGR